MRQGHNSVSAEQLKSIVMRIEKLMEEKAILAEDIKEVFAESKGHGFDNKTIRTIIRVRAMDAQTREEQEQILETYLRALGMTPSEE